MQEVLLQQNGTKQTLTAKDHKRICRRILGSKEDLISSNVPSRHTEFLGNADRTT